MKAGRHQQSVLLKLVMQRKEQPSLHQNYSHQKHILLVVKYIGEIRDEYNKKYEVDYSKHIAELGKIRQAALSKGAWSAAVNAEVARGKAAGLYIEQKIIRTGKLEDLSAEELESRMKTIIDEYSPILEGESVSDLKAKVLQQDNKTNTKN